MLTAYIGHTIVYIYESQIIWGSVVMIIPRWEWRTFGKSSFGVAEEKIKSHGETGFKKSEEKYILSKVSDENVKIRNDVIDIKSLQQINADKLEQWLPVWKEGFPINSTALGVLFTDYFKLDAPKFLQETYSYEEFLAIVAVPGLQVVDVYKERFAYSINGATVEIAEVKFNGVPMRTVCVEHTCPDTVMGVVKELGLQELPNINYINAMKMAVGMERMS